MRPHNIENWDEGRFDVADDDLRGDRIRRAVRALRDERLDLVEVADVLREVGIGSFVLRQDGAEVHVG